MYHVFRRSMRLLGMVISIIRGYPSVLFPRDYSLAPREFDLHLMGNPTRMQHERFLA